MSADKALVSLTIFLFISLGVKAQNGFRQYVVIGTAYRTGSITVLSKDKIEFNSGTSAQILSANEVQEFATHEGRVFLSFRINGKRKFVERLSLGKIGLFKYDSVYFLKVDKDTTLLTKKNYIDAIRSKLDCNKMKFIPFKKRALQSLTDQYNANGCKMRFLSYTKFGFVVGLSPYNLNVKFNDLTAGNYNSSGVTATAGVFADFAIAKQRKLAVSAELYFFNVKGHLNDTLTTNFNSVMLPLGLKWYCSWPFYIKAGTVISHNTSHTASYYDMKTSNISFGVQVGVGADFPISNTNNIHFELKYFNLNNKGNDLINVNCTSTAFLAGITF